MDMSVRNLNQCWRKMRDGVQASLITNWVLVMADILSPTDDAGVAFAFHRLSVGLGIGLVPAHPTAVGIRSTC